MFPLGLSPEALAGITRGSVFFRLQRIQCSRVRRVFPDGHCCSTTDGAFVLVIINSITRHKSSATVARRADKLWRLLRVTRTARLTRINYSKTATCVISYRKPHHSFGRDYAKCENQKLLMPLIQCTKKRLVRRSCRASITGS